METLVSFVQYLYNLIFVKEEGIFLPIKDVEPTNDQINQFINDTIQEIKLDKEIFLLNMRYNNLLRDEYINHEEQNNKNEDGDDDNNGAITEKKIALVV